MILIKKEKYVYFYLFVYRSHIFHIYTLKSTLNMHNLQALICLYEQTEKLYWRISKPRANLARKYISHIK